jgi:hypothetical protein
LFRDAEVCRGIRPATKVPLKQSGLVTSHGCVEPHSGIDPNLFRHRLEEGQGRNPLFPLQFLQFRDAIAPAGIGMFEHFPQRVAGRAVLLLGAVPLPRRSGHRAAESRVVVHSDGTKRHGEQRAEPNHRRGDRLPP